MPLLTCFICSKNKKESLCKRLSEKCHPIQLKFSTILDMLKFCIPNLCDYISEDDIICTNCMVKLKVCATFVEQCLAAINKHKIEEETLKVEFVDCKQNVLVVIKQELKDVDTVQPDIKQESFDDESEFEIKETFPTVEYITKYHNTEDTSQSDTKQALFDDRKEFNVNVQNILDDTHDSWEENDAKLDIQCDLCKEHFATKDILKEHITRNHNPDFSKKPKTKKSLSFGCGKCLNKFKSQKLLTEHLKTAHSITFSCTKCGSEFSSQLRLTAHNNSYNDQLTCKLQCEKCDKKFKCRRDFRRHLARVNHAPATDFYETCKVCSQKFSKQEYKEHLVVHPQNICEMCGEGFSDGSALYQHKLLHDEPNQAICHVCGKGFAQSYKLNNHLKFFHNYAERKVLCTKCPKMFFYKTQLRLHMKRHDKIKDIPCPECSRMFVSKTLLKTHVDAIHLKLRPFACTQCSKTFTRKQYLLTHLENHIKNVGNMRLDGAKVVKNPGLPVKCHYCGKILKNLIQLKLHLKAVHIRARRFQCEFCEMRFISKVCQMRHQESHKDPLYKFRCQTCYKKNESEEELADHMKKHRKFPFRCNVCKEKFGRSYLLENHMLAEHPCAEGSTPQEIINEALENAVFVEGSYTPCRQVGKRRRGRGRLGAKPPGQPETLTAVCEISHKSDGTL